LKWKDVIVVGDYVIFVLNVFSILGLFYFALCGFSFLPSFPTSLGVSVSGEGYQAGSSIEILPLIAVAAVFFATQIYLNFRIFQKNSKTADNKNQHNTS
jgi:hypothetical protein